MTDANGHNDKSWPLEADDDDKYFTLIYCYTTLRTTYVERECAYYCDYNCKTL